MISCSFLHPDGRTGIPLNYTKHTIDLPASDDPLGEALHFLRVSGTFYCKSEFTAPWALELPAFERCMMFHVTTAGECLLDVDGIEPRLLRPGDALRCAVENAVVAQAAAKKRIPRWRNWQTPLDTTLKPLSAGHSSGLRALHPGRHDALPETTAAQARARSPLRCMTPPALRLSKAAPNRPAA